MDNGQYDLVINIIILTLKIMHFMHTSEIQINSTGNTHKYRVYSKYNRLQKLTLMHDAEHETTIFTYLTRAYKWKKKRFLKMYNGILFINVQLINIVSDCVLLARK